MDTDNYIQYTNIKRPILQVIGEMHNLIILYYLLKTQDTYKYDGIDIFKREYDKEYGSLVSLDYNYDYTDNNILDYFYTYLDTVYFECYAHGHGLSTPIYCKPTCIETVPFAKTKIENKDMTNYSLKYSVSIQYENNKPYVAICKIYNPSKIVDNSICFYIKLDSYERFNEYVRYLGIFNKLNDRTYKALNGIINNTLLSSHIKLPYDFIDDTFTYLNIEYAYFKNRVCH